MEKFVVSARKYRPDNFKSVVGQEHITSTLVNAIARNQLSHAYLFCGPRGVGKTTCARIIAKAINCLNPTSDHEACGKCDSCSAFAENSSFNIYELDAASNNSVDNIRSLTEQVRIPPQVGKYSIYIIDEVHMLTTAAFNAFLKTLEEPPSYVIFILATTEKHKILPTILSRCQIYEFKHISVEDVVNYLKYISKEEGVTYDEESLHVIAQKADGCMRDALSMFDKVVTFCDSKLTISSISSALNILDYDTYFLFADVTSRCDYNKALLLFDDVLKKGFDSQIFLSGLGRHFRDLLVARSEATLPLLGVTGALASRYRKQSLELEVSFIFEVLEIINRAESNIKFSLNQRLIAELSLMKMCNITSTVFQVAGQTISPKVTASLPSKSSITPTIETKDLISTEVDTPPEIKMEKTTATKTEPLPTSENIPQITVNNEVERTRSNNSPRKERSSLLGVPRLNIMTTKDKNNIVEINKDENKDIDIQNYILSENDYDAVINGCVIFSSKIKDKNPRIAIAFENARMESGKLSISVPNKILEEEINKQKSKTLPFLSKYSGIKIYNFDVIVEEFKIEKKRILISDEDKYKHLLEQNGNLHKLTETINLNWGQ